MRIRHGYRPLGLLAGLLLANALIRALEGIFWRWLIVLLWGGLLPGGLLVWLVLGEDAQTPLLDKLLLAIGLGYAGIITGLLILHYLPGPLTRTRLLLAFDIWALVLLVLAEVRARRRGLNAAYNRGAAKDGSEAPPPALVRGAPRWRTCAGLVVLILVAVCFRFVALGYSEFQGDEVAVMQRSSSVISGDPRALWYHRKGPAEILLPTLGYALTRRVTEGAARLPFAIANVGAVIGLYVLGSRHFASRAGWWAGLLLALDGFGIAFGRIVQYQSLVLFFGVLGLVCAVRYAQGLERPFLWFAAVLLAMGMLAHTDGVYAALPSALAILLGLRRRCVSWRRAVRLLVGPAMLSLALPGLYYVPFALQPRAGGTVSYWLSRLGHPPFNNLPALFDLTTAYSAVYYVIALVAWLLIFCLDHVSQLHASRWPLPLAFAGLLLVSWLAPGLWRWGGRDAVGLLYASLLAVLLCFGRRQPVWRAAMLWFGLPFLLYTFVFLDPRTHIYTAVPGAALLVGIEIERAMRWAGKRAWLVGASWALILATMAAYAYVAFVRPAPEYQRSYPEHRLRFFWTPFGDEFPTSGVFGFPHRSGWKAVALLFADGDLEGSYASNEEQHITAWYTRNQPNCPELPHYYILADTVQDPLWIPTEQIASEYELVGRVWVGSEPKIEIHQLKPLAQPYADYQLADAATRFDLALTDPDWRRAPLFYDPLARVEHPAQRRLGESIELVGHRALPLRVAPGQPIKLTLYWRATRPVTEAYTVFTHIEDAQTVWGQQDNPPGCRLWPTTGWQVGRVYADPYTIRPQEGTPPGEYRLVVGLYRFETGERLLVTDAQGAPLGSALELGTVRVISP
ncbi:MAG: glycosyltransferase family 39 protein [Anaerolineae bacterium]|nr:glycosyltransferase family 39 protein [Anaerolineae bacterium]